MTNDYGNLELHKVLLSAMKDIDKICREHGLRYFLHAGTLLGAVNHKGFIPWDDDVDISMFRDEYEKFISIIQADYKNLYFIHNYMSDPNFPNNRTVLRILGTKVVHFHPQKTSHIEIPIDIVPLDHAPDSPILRRIQQSLIWVLDAAVQIKLGDIIPHHPLMKCIAILSKVNRVTLGKAIDHCASFFNKKQTTMVGLLTYTGRNPYTGRSGYENDLMLRQWYETPTYIEFEDTKFMTISDPVADLNHRYGAHWSEPYPEEKRITKHDVKSYEISCNINFCFFFLCYLSNYLHLFITLYFFIFLREE